MAWQLTVGADLALPQVKGPRPLPVRAINAYVKRVLIAAERDAVVAEQFMRVVALQVPPKRVFRPSTALRVLLANLRHSRVPEIGAATRGGRPPTTWREQEVMTVRDHRQRGAHAG